VATKLTLLFEAKGLRFYLVSGPTAVRQCAVCMEPVRDTTSALLVMSNNDMSHTALFHVDCVTVLLTEMIVQLTNSRYDNV
jgi:hypothetical protein